MTSEIDKKIIETLRHYKEGLFAKQIPDKFAKTKTEVTKVKKRLHPLRKRGKIKNINFKEVESKKKLEGWMLYYLPENEGYVMAKYPEAFDVPIELKIDKTNKYKEKVIKPILKFFKDDVIYDLEYNYDWDALSLSEEEESKRIEKDEHFLKYGQPYVSDEPSFALEHNIWKTDTLKSVDDRYRNFFEKYHAEKIFYWMDDFEDIYCDYWHLYHKIHRLIRNFLSEKLHARFNPSPDPVEGITTNFQYLLYRNLFEEYVWFGSSKIEIHGGMYEFWHGDKQMECLFKLKYNGENKSQLHTDMMYKIIEIIKEIKEHKEIVSLAKQITELRNKLKVLHSEIKKELTNLMYADILDGAWGAYMHQKNKKSRL